MKKYLLLLFLLLPSTVWAISPFDIRSTGSRVTDLEERLPDASRTILEDFDLFNSALWDSTSWNGGGTFTIAGDSTAAFYHGGVGMLKTKNAANAYAQLRYQGAGVLSPSRKGWEFEARVALNDTAGSEAYIGIVTAADSVTGNTTGVQGAYFTKAAGSSRWKYGVMVTADTTEVDPGVLGSVNRSTFAVFKIIWDGGSKVSFYINGRRLSTIAKAVDATDVLRPLFEVRATSTTVQTMYLDYCTVKSSR